MQVTDDQSRSSMVHVVNLLQYANVSIEDKNMEK